MPYALRMMDGAQLSPRMAASLVEVGTTLATWPQRGRRGRPERCADSRGRPANRSGRGIDVGTGAYRHRRPPGHDQRARGPGQAPDAAGDSLDDLAPADSVARAVAAAVRAPSGGNAQPWRISATDRGHHHRARARIHLDDGRRTPRERRRGRRGGLQRPGVRCRRRDPRAGVDSKPGTSRARCGPSCALAETPTPTWPRCTTRCWPGRPIATTASRSRCPTTSSKALHAAAQRRRCPPAPADHAGRGGRGGRPAGRVRSHPVSDTRACTPR